jgi:HK97 family phage major capsid protein
MTTAIQGKIDERVTLTKSAGDFLATCEQETGGMTAEQDAQWQTMHADIESLKGEIDTLEQSQQDHAARIVQQQQAEQELDELKSAGKLDGLRLRGNTVVDDSGRPASVMSRSDAIDTVLNAWSADGRGAFNRGDPKLQAAFDASGCSWDTEKGGLTLSMAKNAPRTVNDIVAAQSVGTNTAGGFTVPEGFMPNLERALLQYGGMREVATVLRTAEGNDLPMPNMNDTGNTGALLAENAQDAEQDLAFTVTTLGAYKYTSKIIRVSKELESDSSFNIGAEIGTATGTRLGRIENTHATTGTGSSQPNGIVTASTAGKTAASATVITHDELLDLKHSVDPAYRMGGQASWMFNDTTLLAIKKLKDGDGRPLWQAGISVGEPDRIDGDIFVVNQDMADIATAVKSVLYGAMGKFYLREVLGVTLVRLVERYADYHQIGYVAITRFDADLRDAGTNPVKHLVQA